MKILSVKISEPLHSKLTATAKARGESPVLTVDTDFKIYRKNKKQVIPILSPQDRQ